MAETLLKLRSNILASMKVVAPTGGYTAGDMVKVQDTVGVIVATVLVAKEAALIYECEKIIVPKTAATGITFAAGDKVYYNASAGAVTNVSSGNTLCGRALEVAGATDAEALIDLKGNLAA